MNKSEIPVKELSDDSHQLFTVVRDVSLMDYPSFDNETGAYSKASNREVPAMVLMSWPNGYPCVEMELYLLQLGENGYRLDVNGGSVRQEAVKLSHIVRYCYREKINLWELWSTDFSKFLHTLLKERAGNGENKREPNQVIEISDSCIRFFTWLQEAIFPGKALVDVHGKAHQICLKEKKRKDATGRVHASRHFAHNPAPSAPRLKEPMPKQSMDALFTAVTVKNETLRTNKKFSSRFNSPELLELYLSFRSATWETALTVCMAIGCRPAELTTMSLTVNLSSMVPAKELVLDTKKREPNARRRVPVNMGVIVKIAAYIKVRTRFLEQLRRLGKNPNPEDALFLNSEGNPLTKETLTRGFDRLCDDADIATRTCLSMFRHRAITTLIAIHLKEFCSPRLEVAMHALNDSDYMTILTKVAIYTGHKRPESLKAYIHLAWDELGAFDTVQAAVRIHTMLLTIVNDLTPDLNKLEAAPPKEQKSYLTRLLFYAKEAAKEMEEALAAFQHVKANPDLLKDRELAT
jgi:hypothetical protein